MAMSMPESLVEPPARLLEKINSCGKMSRWQLIYLGASKPGILSRWHSRRTQAARCSSHQPIQFRNSQRLIHFRASKPGILLRWHSLRTQAAR